MGRPTWSHWTLERRPGHYYQRKCFINCFLPFFLSLFSTLLIRGHLEVFSWERRARDYSETCVKGVSRPFSPAVPVFSLFFFLSSKLPFLKLIPPLWWKIRLNSMKVKQSHARALDRELPPVWIFPSALCPNRSSGSGGRNETTFNYDMRHSFPSRRRHRGANVHVGWLGVGVFFFI